MMNDLFNTRVSNHDGLSRVTYEGPPHAPRRGGLPIASTSQPMTAPDPIIAALRAKLLDRSARGLATYGVGLDRPDLSTLDWLRHLQEELLDAAGYLERLIRDEEERAQTER